MTSAVAVLDRMEAVRLSAADRVAVVQALADARELRSDLASPDDGGG